MLSTSSSLSDEYKNEVSESSPLDSLSIKLKMKFASDDGSAYLFLEAIAHLLSSKKQLQLDDCCSNA